EQRWAAERLLQIFADHSRFDDDPAVVHQRRHHGLRIDRQIARVELLALEDVEVMPLPGEAFLGEREADLGRTGRGAVMIEREHAFVCFLGVPLSLPGSSLLAFPSCFLIAPLWRSDPRWRPSGRG